MKTLVTKQMGKKNNGVAPEPPRKHAFKPPPDDLNDHFDLTRGVRMEAVNDFHTFTMRPAPKEKRDKPNDPTSRDATSKYKKRLMMKNTLGWYYYLPSFLRPRPKLAAAVAQVDDAPLEVVGATKKRNKMLLTEMLERGKWGDATGLIDLAGLNVNEPDEEGELPLCVAAARGHDRIILKLYRDYRANLLAQRPHDGAHALIAAAENRQVKSVEALLECARLMPVRLAYDMLKQRDTDDNLDAREHAVKMGSEGIVALLDKAEVEVLGRPAVCRHKCGIPITLGQQKAHENEECPMYTCACVNGCGMRVRRTYMDIHQGYDCPKRIRAPSPR